MKTLVTGVTGVFGPHLPRELIAHGHDIDIFSIDKPSDEFKDFEWIQGNINNVEDCLRAMKGRGIEAVHNAAAMPDPTDSPGWDRCDDPTFFPLCMQTNIIGLYNMLQAALRNDVGIFVNTGSNCAVGFGYRIKHPFEIKYLPIDEEHPSEVEDSYSFSKMVGEQLLEVYSRVYGMRCYSLRSGAIMDAKWRVEHKAEVEAEPLTEWSEWLYTWIAPEDLAAAHRMLMEQAHSIVPFGYYYCQGDDTCILEPTMDVINTYRPDLIHVIRERLDGHTSLFSNKRLKAVVGWEPKVSWR